MTREIYFDNSATTRVSTAARAAALSAMDGEYGNPSSAHSRGARAFQALNQARNLIAGLLAVPGEELYFTGSGSEGNNTVIYGAALAGGKDRRRLLVSAVEHPSVLEPAKYLAGRGYELSLIPVNRAGLVEPAALGRLLDEQVALVSVMQVNHETGAVQPLAQIGQMVRGLAPQALFHVDGVQAFCRLPVYLKAWQADAYTISGHKIHGPKGVGGLWLKGERRLPPLIRGGGQERNFRSGTENMPGILAFAAAAVETAAQMDAYARQMALVKETLAQALLAQVEGAVIISPPEAAPHLLNMSFPGARSELLLHYLEAQGLFVSAGSACNSRSSKGSPGLAAMGLPPELVDSAIRFSFCRDNTLAEAEQAAAIVAAAVAEIRGLAGGNRKRR